MKASLLCIVGLASLLGTLLGACHQQPPNVAIAYALGGKGDLSYNDAALKGLDAIRKRGLSVREFEPSSLDDYSKGLEILSQSNPRVIFCVGYLYDDAVVRISRDHRQTQYIVLDGAAAAQPNVSSIKFNATEGSFLAGAVAGKCTQSGIVAFVGGANIPIINEFLTGFSAGAKWVRPDIDVQAFYVGTGGAGFTDPVKGREVALSVIDRHADVVYHAAGSSGNGVIKAAQERNIFAIGVDVDQSHVAPGTVLTSMMKNFDVAMIYALDRLDAGQNLGGTNTLLGISEGAVSLAPIKDTVRDRVSGLVDNATVYLKSLKSTP
jgi:basic membrane protein A